MRRANGGQEAIATASRSGIHKTREVILERLRKGPATSAELSALTGRSKPAVNRSIGLMRRGGYEIANLRDPGGRREGLYVLRGEGGTRRRRQCSVEGCITLLSADNEGDKCRRHLVAAAWRAHMEFLDDVIGLLEDDAHTPAGAS